MKNDIIISTWHYLKSKGIYMKLPLKSITIIVATLIFLFNLNDAKSARIKDIANIEGVSGTQVIGYGLISGLNNTGDNQRATFTVQSVSTAVNKSHKSKTPIVHTGKAYSLG